MTLLDLITQQGKTLVIRGPEGVGKTILARQLSPYGEEWRTHVLISVDTLLSSRFQTWLDRPRPEVVIVDVDIPLSKKQRTQIKGIISQPKMVYERQGHPRETIDTPIFIFCAVKFKANYRRYYTIDLNSKQGNNS